MRYFAWATVLGLASAVAAVQPPAALPPEVKRLPTINDALLVAVADKRTLPEIDQPFMRYVYIDEGGIEAAKLFAWEINIVSRASVIHRPVPLGGGAVIVLRIDLRLYAPRDQDLKDWIDIWEELEFEPLLSLLITRDTVKQLVFVEGQEIPTVRQRVTRKVKRKVTVAATKTKKASVKTVTRTVTEDRDVPITKAKDIDLVRIVGDHVDREAFDELSEATGSQAPLVSNSYFTRRALNTIQEDGLFKSLYSGLYFEFVGVKENKTGQGTDEDRWAEDHLGLGSVKAGITVAQIYDRLRSDQRAAIWRSRITGKPRRIDFGHGPQGRGTQGNWAVTHDIRDKNVDIGNHAMFNLLELKDDAREAIWDKANGLHAYALFDGKGKLAREVPFDVAVNRQIPDPFTPRLQAGLGCISCHETQNDGWQGFTNDARELLGDILGDTANARKTIPDVRDRLLGLYGSSDLDVTKWLGRGRSDYAQATLAATGPFPGQGPQANVVKVSGTKLWANYVNHVYKAVDARQFLRELGFDVEAKDAAKTLTVLLPPVEDLGAGVPEDVRAIGLRRGQSINRSDADLFHGFAAARVLRTLESMKGK